MDLLEDLRMPLLKFKFVMIYITHKMLVLYKNCLNYLKDSIFECFFESSITDLYYYFLKFFFHVMMENPRLNKENIIKNIRNLFRLEKETKAINDRILRDIKNHFEYG